MTAGVLCLLLTAFATPPVPSETAQADFLRHARIVSSKKLSTGVTASRKVVLEKDGLRHSAQAQTVNDQAEHDDYRNNLAAFALREVLGLDNIPVTVLRDFNGRPAAFTWWIDDILMSEKTRQDKRVRPPDTAAWNRQVYIMKVFDLLIHNVDRNMGNVIIDRRWKLWMIDHTRAFQPEQKLHDIEDVVRCDRVLLAKLRGLDAAALDSALAEWLTAEQRAAMLVRRDLIVKAFDARIAAKGEDEVLYDHLRAVGSPGTELEFAL